MLVGSRGVLPALAEQHRSRDAATSFFQRSHDRQQSASAVPLRAAFVSSPRCHHNTCHSATGHEGVVGCDRRVTGLSADSPVLPASATHQLTFDAPALAEETLLDVRVLLCLLSALIIVIYNLRFCRAI